MYILFFVSLKLSKWIVDYPRQHRHVVLLAPHGEHEGGVDVDDLRRLPGWQEVELHRRYARRSGSSLRDVHEHGLTNQKPLFRSRDQSWPIRGLGRGNEMWPLVRNLLLKRDSPGKFCWHIIPHWLLPYWTVGHHLGKKGNWINRI